MKHRFLLTLLLGALAVLPLSARDYNVADFGAKPDGVTLNSARIQAAIDFASANGGGRVVFTPGNWVTGTIYVKDNVTLHLERGATLRDLSLPHGIRVMMVRRGERFLVPHGSMPLEEGDRLVIIMGDSDD